MNKRAIILSICLSIAISIIAPFQIFALRDFERLTVPYTWENYYEPIYAFSDTHLTGGSATMNFSNFMAYYYNNIKQGSLNCVDENFPVMMCVARENVDSIFGLSTSYACVNFDIDAFAEPGQWSGMINDLINLLNNITTAGSAYYYTVGQLENLDYRLYDKVSYQNTLGTYYVYVLTKMKFPDELQFTGGLGANYSFTYSTINGSYSRQYYKIRFDFANATDSNGNYPFFEEDYNGYFQFSMPSLQYISSYSLLDTINCNYGSTGLITSEDKTGCSVFLVRIIGGTIANQNTNGSGTVSATYIPFTESNTDLTPINTKLNTIIDLLSELQIDNTVINDITNNYDIDIDLTIGNILNNLQININTIDLTDSKYQLTNDDKTAFNDLKSIYSNMITSLDSLNMSFIYIIPIICLILGAIL